MSTTIEWTHDGERPRTCVASREIHERNMIEVVRERTWLAEHVANKDWYAVERIAKRLQQVDPERAFDAIDLRNSQFAQR